jgi:hypothetical protein
MFSAARLESLSCWLFFAYAMLPAAISAYPDLVADAIHK